MESESETKVFGNEEKISEAISEFSSEEKDEKCFACYVCDLKIGNRAHLLNHIQNVHVTKELENKKEWPCPDCGKVFKNREYMMGHYKLVHEIRVTVCEFCCKEFRNKSYYKKHIKAAHGTFLRLPCEICGKIYKSTNNLACHMKVVHTTERDMICYICAKLCKNRHYLNKHVKQCQVRADNSNNPVSAYSEFIHEEGGKYICKFCMKTSKTLNLVTSHIRVSHIEDPVNCHICGFTAQNKDYLKRHYKIIHKVSDIQTVNQFIKVIPKSYIDKRLLKKSIKVESYNSEKSETREQLVKNWRIIEEEQRRNEKFKEMSSTNIKTEVTSSSQSRTLGRGIKRKVDDALLRHRKDISKLYEEEISYETLKSIEESSENSWIWTELKSLPPKLESKVYVKDDSKIGILFSKHSYSQEENLNETLNQEFSPENSWTWIDLDSKKSFERNLEVQNDSKTEILLNCKKCKKIFSNPISLQYHAQCSCSQRFHFPTDATQGDSSYQPNDSSSAEGTRVFEVRQDAISDQISKNTEDFNFEQIYFHFDGDEKLITNLKQANDKREENFDVKDKQELEFEKLIDDFGEVENQGLDYNFEFVANLEETAYNFISEKTNLEENTDNLLRDENNL